LKIREIAETVGHILHAILGMRKLSAQWVPRLLPPDNKRNRKRAGFDAVEAQSEGVSAYTPETKEQSKQWTSPGEPAPKKPKNVPSAGKVMATVFWDSQGVIYIDYLEKGKTVKGLYYAVLIRRRIALTHLAKKKVLFHHDNAPAHTSGRIGRIGLRSATPSTILSRFVTV